MFTYLPYSDFAECARCFSTKRLNKQRHEALEVLYMLSDIANPISGRNGFFGSPPKKCWESNVGALIRYGYALCDEWERRMEKPDPCRERFVRFKERFYGEGESGSFRRNPRWLESQSMHLSHRAILAKQEPEHYAKFGFQRDPADEKVFYWPLAEVERELNGDFDPEPPEPNDAGENRSNRRDTVAATVADDSTDINCGCPVCRRHRENGVTANG
jgi:hypothetical protein